MTLALVFSGCGGEPILTAPQLTQPASPNSGEVGSNQVNVHPGLLSPKSVAACLPHVQDQHNRRGAEYEPLVSSAGTSLSTDADLNLTIAADLGGLAYAVYAVGGLSALDAPEALTIVSTPGDTVWLGIANFDTNCWEWQPPLAINGVQTVLLDNGADYLSLDGTFYYVLTVNDGNSAQIRDCLLATTGDAGTVFPAAADETFSDTGATLRVRTNGSPTDVYFAYSGSQELSLTSNLTGVTADYEVALPDNGSLVEAKLTVDSTTGILLRVFDYEPLDVAVIPQSADADGKTCAYLDTSGMYILFTPSESATSSLRSASEPNPLGDFDYSRDSWPADNDSQPPYADSYVGDSWGMALGASWFNASGRLNSSLGSGGLYEHFADEPLWATGVARYLQAQQPWTNLDMADCSGLSGYERVERLNLARAISLAIDHSLPVYSYTGYPEIGELAGKPLVSPLATGHSVLYIADFISAAAFYDPNAAFNSSSNPYLLQLNPWQLADAGFGLPWDSLTGNWQLQVPMASDDWMCEVFDPANQAKYANYTAPALVIRRQGDSPAAQVRVESVDDMLIFSFANDIWADFPEYSVLTMQWFDLARREMFYTAQHLGGHDTTSQSGLHLTDLLACAHSGPATIKCGFNVIPNQLRLSTVPADNGLYHSLVAGTDPAEVTIYYTGPEWEVVLPPSNVAATDDSEEHITIGWVQPAGGLVPDGYNVYRADSLDGPWTGPLNGSPLTVTSFIDTPPAVNTAYWYTVTSYYEGSADDLESAAAYAAAGMQTGAPAPEVTDVQPQGGITGDDVTFVATVTGTPATYSWNFGGGATPNTSSAVSPTVTLGAPGTYNASVTVSSGAKAGGGQFDFQLEVGAEPPNMVTIPAVLGFEVDMLRICYADPVVRRDDRMVIDPFGGATPFNASGYNDVLKTNGTEFGVTVSDYEVYPTIVIIEGTDPSVITGPDDPTAEAGVFVAENRPGMLVVDVSILTPEFGSAGTYYCYRVYSDTGTILGQDLFFVTGVPMVTDPPTGIDWAINVWNREALDIGDRDFTGFTLNLASFGASTPDVLWLEFDGGWMFDYNDQGPYSNTQLLIDHATYGTLAKDIRIVTCTPGMVGPYLGIVTFTDADIYDPGSPDDPGNLKAGETYTLKLDDPGTTGVDYVYATGMAVIDS
ncbi:PKD domain-containing protein [bacterium]|nr:PKD domain-containing protein [bacterium]